MFAKSALLQTSTQPTSTRHWSTFYKLRFCSFVISFSLPIKLLPAPTTPRTTIAVFGSGGGCWGGGSPQNERQPLLTKRITFQATFWSAQCCHRGGIFTAHRWNLQRLSASNRKSIERWGGGGFSVPGLADCLRRALSVEWGGVPAY